VKTVFLAHLFSTLLMTGVIWFAQAVHYPLLERVAGDAFVAYEKENSRRTGWVVIPVMAWNSSPLSSSCGGSRSFSHFFMPG